MAVRAEPSFAEWLRGLQERTGISRSALYRLYVRLGGERSQKSFNNWFAGTHVPDVDDAALIVKALEAALPDGNVRSDFEEFLRRFDSAPWKAGDLSPATV